MAESFDAVIVGGGHNGLVAAAYLARAGRRVLVLERRDRVGGASETADLGGVRVPAGEPVQPAASAAAATASARTAIGT